MGEINASAKNDIVKDFRNRNDEMLAKTVKVIHFTSCIQWHTRFKSVCSRITRTNELWSNRLFTRCDTYKTCLIVTSVVKPVRIRRTMS